MTNAALSGSALSFRSSLKSKSISIAYSLGREPRRCFTGQTRSDGKPPQKQPIITSDDGTRSLRTRQYGNRSLPLPAIMDPVVIAAKEKYKLAKSRPGDVKIEQSPFQKEFELNPFGNHSLKRKCLSGRR